MNPLILGPLERPTTVPVTAKPSSWAGVASTSVPSTTRTGANETVAPSSAPRSSTSMRWPDSTRSCLPPVAITAYIAVGQPTRAARRRKARRRSLDDRVVHDDAPALAHGAGLGEAREQALPDALAGHLHQPQLRDVEDLGAGLVPGQRVAERRHHRPPVLPQLHVDEVDDDDAADVPQPQLAGDL